MKRGFLITSIINREERAVKEFRSKLKSIAEVRVHEISCTSNFERLLEDELKALRIREDLVVAEKFRSILVLEDRTGRSPIEIFGKLRSLKAEFNNVLRVVPLDFVTRFDQEAIEKYIQRNRFEGTYKVAYEGRLCPSGMREKMLQIIVPLVCSKVDLDNPDVLIVVQVFKNLVGLAVMRNVDSFNFSSKKAFQSKCGVPDSYNA